MKIILKMQLVLREYILADIKIKLSGVYLTCQFK